MKQIGVHVSATTHSQKHIEPWMQWRRSLKRILPHLVFWPPLVGNLFPIFFMFTTSFKEGMEYFRNPVGLPLHWTFENYRILLLEKSFVRHIMNSALVSVASVFVVLCVCVLAAYAMSLLKFRGRQLLFDFIVALMAVPVVVTVVPLFALMSRLQMINQYPSAILLYVGFCIPFSIYVFSSFFRSLPLELLDAARVDGANHLQIIWFIILPLARAPTVTLALVNGLWVWNELLIALMFLQSETSSTVMASLARGISRDARNIPLIMAGAFAASVPVLVLIGFGQRYFIRGFLGGYSK